MKSPRNLLCNITALFLVYSTVRNFGIRQLLPSESRVLRLETTTIEKDDHTIYPHQTVTSKILTQPLLPDTTVIITSNLIPSHPSTEVIDKTIASLTMLQGLRPTSVDHRIPLIITVDGPYGKDRGTNTPLQQILNQYTETVQKRYANHDTFNVTILAQRSKVKLIKNMEAALPLVKTPFMYVLQHDLPFVLPVNHTSLVQTALLYPEEVRLVRFGLHKTLSRRKDIPDDRTCGAPFFHSTTHGIDLAKTHTWSDNNHFTTKSYYEEMFSTVEGFRTANFMEVPMRDAARQNCSRWGTWLYGEVGHGPMLQHLDGKHYATPSRSSPSS